MKFNVTQALVEVLLEINSGAAETTQAGEIHLSPRLHKVDVTSPPADEKAEIASSLAAQVNLLIDPRDVPALLSGIVGPGKHQLLVKLAGLSVKKTGTLEGEYEEVIPEGQKPRLKPAGFLKPVQVTVKFVVLDYIEGLK
jgi:hypothetical protein